MAFPNTLFLIYTLLCGYGTIVHVTWAQECSAVGEKHAVSSDCGSYFECALINEVWQLVPKKCPGSQKFDDNPNVKKCVDEECPQPLPEGPGWHCSEAGEFNVLPTDSSKYYKCHKCSHGPKGWCYTTHSCPDKELQEIPDISGFYCQYTGQKTAHPLDCTRGYTCYARSPGPGWCVAYKQCPTGQWFKDVNNTCGVYECCPNGRGKLEGCNDPLEEKPSTGGFYCQYHGQTNVHPSDCTRWYACSKCNKPSGWCVSYDQCPTGQWFDDKKDKCGEYGGCCPNGRGNKPCPNNG